MTGVRIVNGPRMLRQRLTDWITTAPELIGNTIKKKYWLFLIGISGCYFLFACVRASRKWIWFDEYFTVTISRLPHVSDILAALRAGVDLNPPLYYVITRAFTGAFGAGNLSVRLPAIFGFWVMTLCVFHFVSKRANVLWALVALLFVLMTNTYQYAYEARAYAFVLGCCGVSLVSWQAAAERGKFRGVYVVMLALALSAAVASHFYAVLLIGCIAAGELVRTYVARKLDLSIWLALTLPVVPLVLAFRLIKTAMTYSQHFWAKPSIGQIPRTYEEMLGKAALPLVLGTLVCLIVNSFRTVSRTPVPNRAPIPAHEIAAITFLAALPVIGVLAGFVTHAFTYRYALAAVVGISILFGLGGHVITRVSSVNATVFLLVFLGWFLSKGITMSLEGPGSSWPFGNNSLVLNTDLPIVVSHSHTFIELILQAPSNVRHRFRYLTDIDASARLGASDNDDRNLSSLRQFAAIPVERYSDFIASHSDFFVYGGPNQSEWLLRRIMEDGGCAVLNGQWDSFLFRISIPCTPGSAHAWR